MAKVTELIKDLPFDEECDGWAIKESTNILINSAFD